MRSYLELEEIIKLVHHGSKPETIGVYMHKLVYQVLILLLISKVLETRERLEQKLLGSFLNKIKTKIVLQDILKIVLWSSKQL